MAVSADYQNNEKAAHYVGDALNELKRAMSTMERAHDMLNATWSSDSAAQTFKGALRSAYDDATRMRKASENFLVNMEQTAKSYRQTNEYTDQLSSSMAKVITGLNLG